MAGERSSVGFFVDTDHTDDDQNIDATLVGQKWDTSTNKTITFSFIDSANDLSFNPGVTFANEFSNTQKIAARKALDELAKVADVNFEEIGDDPGENNANGTLRFADYTGLGTAFGYYPNSGESGGDMAFRDGTFETAERGTYEFVTFMHEIGHAMGLKHGHEHTAGTGFPDVGHLEDDKDGMEYSIMTYNSFVGQEESPAFYTNNTGRYAQTLMMYDIAALQRMYGANWSHNGGNTVYTFDPVTGQTFYNGVGEDAPSVPIVFRTEWDGGGNDTYDLSNFMTNLMIDLRPGMYSDFDVGGNALRAQLNAGWDSNGNYVGASEHEYARGHLFNAILHEGDTRSLIENANGGSGNDAIRGNQAHNILRGNAGNDTLNGGDGKDTLRGGNDNDSLLGGSGRDVLRGDNGNDTLKGGNNNDLLQGGNGLDSLDGGKGNDTLNGGAKNDVLKGGSGDDSLIGEKGRDTLLGGKGEDTLLGGDGADSLNGGDNNDLLRGGKGNDTLDGGSGKDVLKGDGGNDSILGNGGADTLKGGSGSDTLEGGKGNDRLFGDSDSDTFLFNGATNTGNDTIRDFENGSDIIKITGGVTFGDLTITQNGGNTVVTWSNGSVTLTGETGTINEDDFMFG